MPTPDIIVMIMIVFVGLLWLYYQRVGHFPWDGGDEETAEITEVVVENPLYEADVPGARGDLDDPDTPNPAYTQYPLSADEQMILSAGSSEISEELSREGYEVYREFASAEIGRPHGNFVETTVSTGEGVPALARGNAPRRTRHRDSGVTLDSVDAVSEASPWKRTRVTPLAPRRHRRYADQPADSVERARLGFSPAAKSTMRVPDPSRLRELPEKCEYVTAGGARIRENCSSYIGLNPRVDII